VAAGPLAHFSSFWKPLMDDGELAALATYREPGDGRVRGVNVLQPRTKARSWRVADGKDSFRLFAAVHPLDEVPPSAEVIAEILDTSGKHGSYVLWFPAEGAMVVPFDPDAAIGSFRREEYMPEGKRMSLPQPVLNLYYSFVKSMLPSALKRQLRRTMARRGLASSNALDWPADESADALQRFLMRLVLVASGRQELSFAWFWPDGHPLAAVLTHDVETAQGLPNIASVTEMELARGLRSSFNFVPADYEVPESLLRKLDDEGFEVGVHGYTHDGLLFSNWPTFQQRVAEINAFGRRWGASGFRSPATYRNPEWLHHLEFEYDSSFSNTAPCEPQPGGCGSFFPYPIDGLVELPITVPQDHTLFELLEQTDAGTWLAVLGRIRDANGMACVLTHPDPSSGYIGYADNRSHYADLLDAVAASGAWTPLPRDLVRWWSARALASSARVEAMGGMSYGTAVLDDTGHVEIVPPAR
jgi:peptidoglycan/xylan/chitin deacetylase (PgdA/CDA1 family)